ncbi:hypothetical protein B0A55_13602, partial [Friedmanniomyces simplex]
VSVMNALTIKGSYSGTRKGLAECLDLMAKGVLKPLVETKSIEDLPSVLHDLDEGKVKSRMVLLPDWRKEASAAVQGLKTFFSDFLEPTLFTEKQPLDRQEGTPAAERVLELPELLENVLQYLEIPDILRFQQVNRSACASIDGSPRL